MQLLCKLIWKKYFNILIVIKILMLHTYNSAKQFDIHAAHNCELPEDGQELRTKHVGEIINKDTAQQAGIKYHLCDM
jgi:hypothetical protein